MIKNYFRTAYRFLARNKLYSAINIVGLAVGLAAFLMIILFVRDEVSYDRWLPDSDRIYRLHSAFLFPGRAPMLTVRSAGPMMAALPARFGEIEDSVRLNFRGLTVLTGDNAFSETLTLTDPSFFDVFDLPLVEGSRETAFTNFSSIVITESIAQKYFGDEPALGKTLTLCCLVGPDTIDFVVSAVLQDLPDNTHLTLSMLTLINEPLFSNSPSMFESWYSVNNFTYFKFKDGGNIDAVLREIPQFLDDNIDLPQNLGFDRVSDIYKLKLMSLGDLYLNAAPDAGDMGDMKSLGSMASVIGFSVIASMILAIAGINFINLATARSTLRAREVSMRKVLGANKTQIVAQFLGESTLVTILAMLLAVVMIEVSLPWYNAFLGKTLALNLTGDPSMIAILALTLIVVSLLSGLYPAFYLARILPAKILKANQSGSEQSGGLLRSTLVVAQFAVSITLLLVTIIVYNQTVLAKTTELGFDRDNKLVIHRLYRTGSVSGMNALRDEVLRHPAVESAVFSSEVPTENWENSSIFQVQDKDGIETQLLNRITVGFGFFEAYGVAPLAGRLFDEAFGTDSIISPENPEDLVQASAIINEATVRRLGYTNPEDALGTILAVGLAEGNNIEFTVVGVIPDIQFRSVRYAVVATVYFVSPPGFQKLTVNFHSDDPLAFADDISEIWASQVAAAPFAYNFLSDMIDSQYQDEDSQMIMFLVFAGLAIIIASLGLYGLASFSVARRTKEVGIRKVMGASIIDVVRLMVWQFSKPVLIANLIAWPVAWYFLQDWLLGFEQRTVLNPLLFVAAGGLALVIAWLTVGGHAFRAARSNPIEALRYE